MWPRVFGHISPALGHILRSKLWLRSHGINLRVSGHPPSEAEKLSRLFLLIAAYFFLVDPSRLTSNNVKGGASRHANGHGPWPYTGRRDYPYGKRTSACFASSLLHLFTWQRTGKGCSSGDISEGIPKPEDIQIWCQRKNLAFPDRYQLLPEFEQEQLVQTYWLICNTQYASRTKSTAILWWRHTDDWNHEAAQEAARSDLTVLFWNT